jgi:tRNA A-37 threonylcarbamoyl transferase component Bud32
VKNGALELLELTAGGIHWQVLPECRDQLLGPQGLRLEEWLQAGLAQVVKHGPHRTVYRVALPGLNFYLKHYRLADVRAWLRQWLRPAKARMEFEHAMAVAARRVPTVIPVALGERWVGPRPSDSFLITRSLHNAESVSTFIEDTLPTFDRRRVTRVRQRLAVALGEFVAHLHDSGVAHRDLHAANMLIRLDADDCPGLHLIDLHAVHLGAALHWQRSRENLVILNRWFVLRASRTDRLRFWRSYCRQRSLAGTSWTAASGHPSVPKDLARDLERRTWRSNLRFWRHRDRRCLRTNRYYLSLRSKDFLGYAVRDLDSSSLAHLLADPDAPFQQPGAVLLKDSRSSTVTEFDVPVNGVLRRVIYKRFRVTSWSDPWLAALRPSPALRSWIYGQGLRERCLPTARPLVVFHRRRRGLLHEGYLLTEKIAGGKNLHDFLAGLQTLGAPEQQRLLRLRLDQVGRLVCSLHHRQMSHRDLKAGNLLLTSAGVSLIDLVGVVSYRRLSRARRVQNLARLNASFHQSPQLTRTDRLRFLRTYLQWGLFGPSGWKRWWRDVAAGTQAKIARNARSGRPLA